MYSVHTCPRCATPISLERMLGNVVVCTCGWTGKKSDFDKKGRQLPIKKLLLGVGLVAAAYMTYDAQAWGKHYPHRLLYKTMSALKQTSAGDEASMAKVCSELANTQCATEALTKALAKSPKNYELAGALAVELTKAGDADRAILTFQNFFSHMDGNDTHMHFFAKALSSKEYIDDATEWFYKGIQANPKNYEAAQDLIQHLSKNEMHPEALGVIGHYNQTFPETRKKWADLTAQVKSEFNSYTAKYDVQEMKIAGLNRFLYAPVKFAGNNDTQIFLVDPESDYLTVDLNEIKNLGIDYKVSREKEVSATNGRSLKGVEVTFPELVVGPFKLKDVKAMACENCAFLLGKDVMRRLNFKAQNSKGIRYITLKQ